MFFVVSGWVLFRAENIGQAIDYFQNMYGAMPLIDDGFIEYFRQHAIFLVIACIGSTPYPKMLVQKYEGSKLLSVLGVIFLLLLFIFSVSFIVKNTYNPFIYFNF